MNLLSIIYILLIFIIGFFIAKKTARRIRSNLIIFVYLLHMFMSAYYYVFAQTRSADANMYFNKALYTDNIWDNFGHSTDFIVFLTSILVRLGFNKLSVFFLFGLFGFIGFIYFIKLLPSSKDKLLGISLIYLILLLPGFHFWTAALGKDSLFFMLLMMFFYSLKNYKKHPFKLIFSLTLLTFIRPHMGFILMLSIIIAIIIKNPTKYKPGQIGLAFLAVLTIVLTLPFLFSFLNIDQMEMENINDRFESFTEYGAKNADDLNSYVDVRSYNLPMKMFAYLFRPLFFDAHSFLQLLASFENTFLLFLILRWLIKIKLNVFKWYRKLNDYYKIMFVYAIVGWVILSLGMYNLGLASRQKYMLLPILFVLFTLSKQQTLNIKK